MPRPFRAEEVVEIDGEKYHLAIDFAAIDATESLLDGRSYLSVLATIQSAGDDPPLGLVGKVVYGMTRRHHPLLTLDEIAGLTLGDAGLALGYAVERLLLAAFPTTDEAPKEKEENPLEPRGASNPS